MSKQMTREQAHKLTDVVIGIRPEWSGVNIAGLLQKHTFGFGGLAKIEVDKLTALVMEAALRSPEEPTQLAA